MTLIYFVPKSAFEQNSAGKADLCSASYYLQQLDCGPEAPFPRWFSPMAGKLVLAVSWELSQGLGPGTPVLLHVA